MRARVGRFLLILVALLIVVYGVLALTSQPVRHRPWFKSRFLVIAHRGGRGLWPENTLFAFEQATAMGVDVLEMDVHSTADDVLVLMHDDAVDRTTDGSGSIHDFTLAELQQLDAGYEWTDDDGATYPFRGQGITVPTLEEVFTAIPDMPMNIEIKQIEPSIVEPFCQLLQAYGREENVLVGSFDADTVKAFRKECPGVATSATEPEARVFLVLNTIFLGAVYRAPSEAFQLPEYHDNLHVVTGRLVQGAHTHNIDVHVWTVNETEDMKRMLDLGVDGIITDYPDRLLAVLER